MRPLKKLKINLVILSNSDLSGCYRSMLGGPFDKLTSCVVLRSTGRVTSKDELASCVVLQSTGRMKSN